MIDNPLNRLKVKRGSDLPQSKLTEEKVIEIRERIRKREEIKQQLKLHTNQAIAKEHNVHIRTIDRISTEEGWTHV